MSRWAAPDIPSAERCASDVGEALRDACCPCGGRDRAPAACGVRGEVANALTAILLHAEAICRWSARQGIVDVEIVASARQVAANAGRVWMALDDTTPATGTDGAAEETDQGPSPRFQGSGLTP
ncbi:hypothetical protein KPL78_26045 [Roseomonas sp. HJA6]|uniref:Uncharacterized protein n=1 Tax=Roseomonas alba TaxID=2846776 RepID=A0ABS7AGA3_9PROT|nr:hypothetical protein [Neoroseomonas alba]MBW6401343.1 hypothetical protein [Neoroseomonas alba]